MLETVRWGIIGCGDVTEIKSGPALNRIQHSELVAVMRRNAEKAKDYANRHQVGTWYSDAEKLIHDPSVNAIYVATPPDSHCEYTLKALEVGKPVYVEKPMAKSHQECELMVKKAQEMGLPLLVAYYRRCLPSFVKAKELVDSGQIGEVRGATIRLFQSLKNRDMHQDEQSWRVHPEISGGGYFFDLAAHQFDILDHILGPIEKVFGTAGNQGGLYPAEDIVSANFQFASGVLGTGLWCFTVSEESVQDEIEIIGSKGKIAFPCFGSAEVCLHTSNGRQVFSLENPKHIQEPLIQTVVDHFRGKGTCPSTGISGMRTNRVLETILSTYYS